MMQGLDETFDAVFFVGYHGSISGPPSVLSHTYNPEVISAVRLGGVEVGESGVNALVADACGVPIALVTGDDVTLAEAEPVAPGHVGVQVKTSLTRFSAHHLSPSDACERIEAGARRPSTPFGPVRSLRRAAAAAVARGRPADRGHGHRRQLGQGSRTPRNSHRPAWSATATSRTDVRCTTPSWR